jgi:hypothetical protein
MSVINEKPENKTTPEPPAPAEQAEAGQPQSVDVEAQEEAAKDRAEGGGYD